MDCSKGKEVISPVGCRVVLVILADFDYRWGGGAGGGVHVGVGAGEGGEKTEVDASKCSTCVVNADAQYFKDKL